MSTDSDSTPSVGGSLDESEEKKSIEKVVEPFNYDEILEHVGQLGKYQLWSYLWLCLPMLFPSIIVMSYSFIGGVPEYRCLVNECEANDTDLFSPDWLNNTTPWDESSKRWSHCEVYNNTWDNLEECIQGDYAITQEKTVNCDQWVYDTSVFSSTIFTTFELTCENEWLQPIPNISFMVGMLFGAASIGALADIIGRRWTYLWVMSFYACMVTATAFSPDIITLSVFRFFSGVAGIGLFDVIYVWGVESVGKNYHVLCGFLYQIVFSIGAVLIGGVAYFVRDWRTLQLIIGVPLFATIAIFWIVPESTLWLISRKRYEEASVQIKKAAKTNKKTVPEELLIIPDQPSNSNEKPSIDDGLNQIVNTEIEPKKKESFLDIFRSMVMLKRILFISITWCIVSMGYYGITYSANNLSGDYYLNYQLVMLVEIPAYLAGRFAVDRVGRKVPLVVGLLAGGIACLATGLVPEEPTYIRITLSLIGKFFASAIFGVIYAYTVELFPTSTRTAALGFCNTSARVGSILAPIIADAGRTINQAIPYILFSILYISVALVTLLLPETKGKSLPATMEEAINLEKNSKTCFCRSKKKSIDPETSIRVENQLEKY